jgi:prevent-host-death family protein
MKKIALSEAKDQLSKYLHDAEKEEIVILRHGRPAGVLIGFSSEDDWFDYRLENDPRFLARIEQARGSARAGKAVRLEDLSERSARSNKRLQPARTKPAAQSGRRRARG